MATNIQKLNLREIAKRARVSTATVSRAINHIPTVNPFLARRVWKVVKESGYYPNTLARALVSGQSRILGLIVSELINPFFAELVQEFESLAAQHGYEVLLRSTAGNPGSMETGIRRMIERRVDGVAVLSFGVGEQLIKDLPLHCVPVVVFESVLHIPGIGTVRIDYQNGIRQAVQHLAALRHNHIAFVAGPDQLGDTLIRKKAFQDAMAEIGSEARQDLIVPGEHSVESGMKVLLDLWCLRPKPTAVLCADDLAAMGVLAQAYELGINVPNDLSVVGFNDIRAAQFTAPPLTTVRVSTSDLALQAFQMLADRDMTSIPSENAAFVVKTDLILRRSTGLQSG